MTNGRVRLFDVTDIDTLPWPNTEETTKTKGFLIPLIKNGVQHYIENVDSQVMALLVDDFVLPLTVNNNTYQNSYVCSPYCHYVTYAQESVRALNKQWLNIPLQGLLWGLGKILRACSFNKVIIVNNWPFSTNLHPNLSKEQIIAIKETIQKQFPQHAILFRSINTFKEKDLFSALNLGGFNLIASRQVFFLNAKKDGIFNSRIFKSDFKLFEESSYEVLRGSEIPPEDIQRLTELYRGLYVDKHSHLNPQLNEQFFTLALSCPFFKLLALRKDGCIDAMAGYFSFDDVMTSPMVGYDISRSRDDKLYRLTSTMLNMEAKKNKMLFNLSSGASFFKKIRRGEGALEYTAVYHKHLPLKRRMPWLILKVVIDLIGIPFMKYYDR